jgi:hypothetical protein
MEKNRTSSLPSEQFFNKRFKQNEFEIPKKDFEVLKNWVKIQ